MRRIERIERIHTNRSEVETKMFDNMIAAVDFRKDGKLHDYAVRFINKDGSFTWGFASSVAVYNPGERVQTTDGLWAIIDYEI